MLYAILVDGKYARHKSKLGVFSDLKQLKKHAWRYVGVDSKYTIAKLEVTDYLKED